MASGVSHTIYWKQLNFFTSYTGFRRGKREKSLSSVLLSDIKIGTKSARKKFQNLLLEFRALPHGKCYLWVLFHLYAFLHRCGLEEQRLEVLSETLHRLFSLVGKSTMWACTTGGAATCYYANSKHCWCSSLPNCCTPSACSLLPRRAVPF